jgi:hypothetical protein
VSNSRSCLTVRTGREPSQTEHGRERAVQKQLRHIDASTQRLLEFIALFANPA